MGAKIMDSVLVVMVVDCSVLWAGGFTVPAVKHVRRLEGLEVQPEGELTT